MDITSTLMITTAKFTQFGFNIADGMKPKEKLT